jgi:mono/diheme cytochrome c family protein
MLALMASSVAMSEPGDRSSGGPIRGAKYYSDNCGRCHKIGGTGGIIVPDLQGVFERQDEAWIRTQIQHPRQHNSLTVMRDFGFTDDQVAAIVEVPRGTQGSRGADQYGGTSPDKTANRMQRFAALSDVFKSTKTSMSQKAILHMVADALP